MFKIFHLFHSFHNKIENHIIKSKGFHNLNLLIILASFFNNCTPWTLYLCQIQWMLAVWHPMASHLVVFVYDICNNFPILAPHGYAQLIFPYSCDINSFTNHFLKWYDQNSSFFYFCPKYRLLPNVLLLVLRGEFIK